MLGSQCGSGPGWYYKGKHYDAPQTLHEAMNAEINRLELEIGELKAEVKKLHDGHGYKNSMGPCVCKWCKTETLAEDA